MNVRFKDEALREIYERGTTKVSKYKTFCRNKALVNGYQRAVAIMHRVASTKELELFSFLHYEKLRYRNESSVRVMNREVWRLIFIESENSIEVELLDLDNKHYGNKR